MSTDTFEDTLRGVLHDATDAEALSYLDIDPDVVLGHGRRVVRRRRAAAGVVAAGVIAVASTVGLATLGEGMDRTSTPADTSPSPTWATGTVTADLTRGATLGDTWGPAEGRPSVRVSVDLGRRLVTSALIGTGAALPDAARVTLPSNPRTATWTSRPGSGGLVTGVLPAAASQVVFVWDGEPGDGTQDLEPLSGTPYQAFAIWHERGQDDTAQLAGLIWTDGTTVHDSAGDEVRSARSGTAQVFVDQAQGVFGIFGDGTTSTRRLDDVPKGTVPTLMTGVESGSGTVETTVLLVLPARAGTVNVRAVMGATLHSSEVYEGGTTGETLVVARLTVPTSAVGTGVDSVSWTNADGSPGSGRVG